MGLFNSLFILDGDPADGKGRLTVTCPKQFIFVSRQGYYIRGVHLYTAESGMLRHNTTFTQQSQQYTVQNNSQKQNNSQPYKRCSLQFQAVPKASIRKLNMYYN